MTTLKHLPLPPEPKRERGVFWRPNATFLDELAEFLVGKKILEIFAGNGYLAAELFARGASIQATSSFSSHDAHTFGLYHPVQALDAVSAVTEYGKASDVLLVCWPTVTPAVLHAVEQWGPDKDVVFIGEVTDYSKGHLGGCATDEFFESITVQHHFTAYQGNMLEQALVCRLSPTEISGYV